MTGGLFDALGLPEGDPAAGESSTGLAAQFSDQFRDQFRDGISGLNQSLQQAAATLDPGQHEALAADRGKLFEAYQQAQGMGAGAETIDRILSAAGKLGEKATAAAGAALEAAGQWAQREGEFDDIALQVAGLADAGHPKSAALQQLVDAIRQRVGDRQFSDCLQALDGLAPKLAEILAGTVSATGAGSTKFPTDPQPPAAGMATLKVHVAYQGTPVPGAMVRLSTGPTSQPDATTDGAGVAYFQNIQPGAYHVNAAKQAFVFQPVHVAEGQLTPGATLPVRITKAAQGNPPAPPYLYSGGGSAVTPPTVPPPTMPPGPPTTPPGPPTTPPGPPPIGPPVEPPVHPTPPPTTPQAGTATVEVRVIDENGLAVPKAMVRVSSGPINPPDAETDSAGVVRFQLIPGEYHINAAKLDKVWQPAHIAPGALQPGATYPVRMDKPFLPKPEEKGDVGSLSLRVYSERRIDPLQGALVDIDGNPKFSTKTDSQGVAQVAGLPVGPHAIRITAADPKYGAGATSLSVHIEKDKNLTRRVKVKLGEDRGSISVVVRWEGASKDGRDKESDVNGAIVTLDPAGEPPQATERGSAYFGRVPFGVYTLTATIPQTGQTITLSDVELNNECQSRDVTMLARRSSDPSETELAGAGELYVLVVTEGLHLSLRDVKVTLSSPDAPVLTTGVDGTVLFRRVPARDYVVTATASLGGESHSSTVSVRVAEGVRAETQIVLPIPKGDLLVRTFDMDTGVGIEGVPIQLEPNLDGGITGADGTIIFSDLPTGPYKVKARAADGETITISTTVEADKENKAGLMMTADEAPLKHGTILVTVMGAAGLDVQHAVVKLTPMVAPPMLAVEGLVKFEQIPFGEYEVEASLENAVTRQVVDLAPHMPSASAFLMLESAPASEPSSDDAGESAADATSDMADEVGDLW